MCLQGEGRERRNRSYQKIKIFFQISVKKRILEERKQHSSALAKENKQTEEHFAAAIAGLFFAVFLKHIHINQNDF